MWKVSSQKQIHKIDNEANFPATDSVSLQCWFEIGNMMFETVAVCVIVVTGMLAMVQAYYVGKCFEAGQPREDAHFNNEILKQDCESIIMDN